jgi:hypothetical protein
VKCRPSERGARKKERELQRFKQKQDRDGVTDRLWMQKKSLREIPRKREKKD